MTTRRMRGSSTFPYLVDLMLSNSIGWLRLIGIAEGVSYLVLLGIAMPLKYIAGMPMAVRIVGMLHGVLFVLFVLAVAWVAISRRWPKLRIGEAVFASLYPFGTFIFDRKLKQEEQELLANNVNNTAPK